MIKTSSLSFLATLAVATCVSPGASANPFNLFNLPFQPAERSAPVPPVQALPYQSTPGLEDSANLSVRFRRQIVDYRTNEAPGTIIIDTSNTYLYLVMGNGRAMRYGIGVGRDGFTWAGTQHITKKAEWPDWTPPAEMIARQPYLPRYMAGGPGNPLGARAMYLGNTIYRIHGTNAPETIGGRVSSGCIRLTNDDVTDLFSRVQVGTKVVVMPTTERRASIH
jgi:lipoprotein-anchoring transpeptidase ErfK/SrfK